MLISVYEQIRKISNKYKNDKIEFRNIRKWPRFLPFLCRYSSIFTAIRIKAGWMMTV